jgi:DNA-directed RNA polymerase specialized sigma24 family protein
MRPKHHQGFRPVNGHLANGVGKMDSMFEDGIPGSGPSARTPGTNGTPIPDGSPHGIPERRAEIIEETPEGRSRADTLIARYQEQRAAMQETSLELWNLRSRQLSDWLGRKMSFNDAADVEQETAKRLLKTLPNFKGSFAHDDDLLAYLKEIALSATRDHFGKRPRAQRLPDAEDASRATIDPAQREASDILEERERSGESEESFDSISGSMRDLGDRLAHWLSRNGGTERPSPRPGPPTIPERFLNALRSIPEKICLAFELREKIDKGRKRRRPGHGSDQGP